MIENKYFEDYNVGDVVVSDAFTVTEADVTTYCRLVGDNHRIHIDKAFCMEQIGVSEVVVPGCLTLALADSRWATLVTPSSPYSPHYGHDKVRYLSRLLSNESVFCEFRLIEKRQHDNTYGMLIFQTYVKKSTGESVLFEIDKLLIPFREKAA
jgi:acyl dehydratase